IDLLEEGVAVALVVAVVKNPVLWLALRIEQAIIGDVGCAHGGQGGCYEQRPGKCAGDGFDVHGFLPFIFDSALPIPGSLNPNLRPGGASTGRAGATSSGCADQCGATG